MSVSSKKSSAMAELPQLPRDILANILSRLPVKPLGRFKCVSKAWCSLISSPQFAKMQVNFCKQDSTGNHQKVFLMTSPFLSIDYEAYSDGDNNLPITQLAFPIREPLHDQIIGSCDGLICAVFDEEHHHIIVWNPLTGESRELPRLNYSPESGDLFYGFGYDGNLDDYKVVIGFRTTSPDSSIWGYKIEVFTLKSCRWRTIEFLQCGDVLTGAGTLANGVLHWQLEKKNVQNEKRVTVPFDLEAEKFLDAIPLPDVIDHNFLSDELTVHGDCICVYTSFYGCCGSDYEAWILKGNGTTSGAKWTSLTKFNSEEIPGGKYWIELLCVAKNGNVLMDLDGYEIVLYNPRDQTFKRFPIEQEWGYFTRIMYVESLVSPSMLLMGSIGGTNRSS